MHPLSITWECSKLFNKCHKHVLWGKSLICCLICSAKPDDPVLIKIYCKIGWKELIGKFKIVRRNINIKYIFGRKCLWESAEDKKYLFKESRSYIYWIVPLHWWTELYDISRIWQFALLFLEEFNIFISYYFLLEI